MQLPRSKKALNCCCCYWDMLYFALGHVMQIWLITIQENNYFLLLYDLLKDVFTPCLKETFICSCYVFKTSISLLHFQSPSIPSHDTEEKEGKNWLWKKGKSIWGSRFHLCHSCKDHQKKILELYPLKMSSIFLGVPDVDLKSSFSKHFIFNVCSGKKCVKSLKLVKSFPKQLLTHFTDFSFLLSLNFKMTLEE